MKIEQKSNIGVINDLKCSSTNEVIKDGKEMLSNGCGANGCIHHMIEKSISNSMARQNGRIEDCGEQ